MAGLKEFNAVDDSPYNILIVDDNQSNLFTLHSLLKRVKNIHVIEADSGEKALKIVIEQPVDLILMDVQMPEMDGFETAKHLKMTSRTREIPIVFITAVFKAEEFIKHGYEVGAIDYLTKPIDDNLLISRLSLYTNIIGRKRAEESLLHAHQMLEKRVRERTRELTIAYNQLKEVDKLKSTFLSTMSNELHNPLNAIIGFASMLRRGMEGELTDTQLDRVTRIEAAGQQLLELITEVFEISMLESGSVKAKAETFSMIEVINEAVAKVKPDAERKGIRVCVKKNGDTSIRSDREWLIKCLLNYLSNAVKYSTGGTITVCASEDGENIQVDVMDEGIGIKKEDQERVFLAFERLDTPLSAVAGGTGLGLYLTRLIIHNLLKGEHALESTSGKGSRFSFTIPKTS
ncbi:Signal transduction histidine kinase [Mariprofundus aestuarium]|uniref:histidine kinase n=1 Tax=Mariprofundus aestuarium TaxID=1921086 RepID=A0A2K8L8J1_MARES|nr:hybrid sensor histidine kinase/response regulator [Mariprofundus aestuarium]ATX80596.1 Signal transduction histidine kinase [Mariprofundus aestuarium]